MKKLIIILISFFAIFILADFAEAALSCSVTAGSCSGTTVFKMQSTSNSHAETIGSYNYFVCCSGVTGLGADCVATNKAVVLRLSATTNAHVEKESCPTCVGYPVNACLSVPAGQTVTCSYYGGSSCSDLGSDYACLASISGDTNAHVADCSAPPNGYSTKVCCAVTVISVNQPPSISSVADSPDPVTVGSPIAFTVNWSDPNAGDLTRIHICKTNAISGQTCTGGSWCDSASFSATSPTQCTYTTTGSDVGTQNYYAFVCDDENACSSSVSGTFTVNAAFTAPSVTTTVATITTVNLQNNQAVLNGNITNTGGQNADLRGFDWGTSPGVYTGSWTEGTAGSYVLTGSFSYTLTMVPDTIYYYRAKARNSAGWGYGPERRVVIYTATAGQQSFPTLSVGHNPTAAISCDVSLCGPGATGCTGYTGCPFRLVNNSTDPLGDSDIVISRWYRKPQGAPDSAYVLIPYCDFTSKSDCTLQSDLTAGNYTIRLYVQDTAGAGSNATIDIQMRQEIIAGFMCSLDNVNWQVCENLTVPQGVLVYFKDDLPDGCGFPPCEHSSPSEGATITSRIWTRNGTVFSSGNNPNPSTTTNDVFNTVILSITDSVGRTDSASHLITASTALPRWWEIPPILWLRKFLAYLLGSLL